MPLDRRSFLTALPGALLASRAAPGGGIVDAAGRNVPIPPKVTRVLPAAQPAAILLYTLAPELLLGWPDANRPDACEFMLPEVCRRPELGTIIGRGDAANIESVRSLKPDLILDVGSTSAASVSLANRVQQQTGIPYALLDGHFLFLAKTYQLIGALIGRIAAGEDFADHVTMTLAVITNRIAAVSAEQRPTVYYASGPRGLVTGLGGSINLETIELIARNVAGGTNGELTTVSIEQVRRWNPDVIITVDREFAAAVRGDPSWAAVKAVREKRVHLTPKLPFGLVDVPPAANRLIGLWWLSKILYPERFKEDLRELTRDFYAKFYHVTPNDAQIARILAARD